ncbi:protein-L-isoaspartate(D-aspartate) O-methyltransferase [Novosphingobium sp. 1529]|uniref:protein-L-isoaspartate O-methyltransferase family protein n=1 Tax=Novosphingobium TaxID=165696 RepID=UPI00078846F0|nr:protein-L-isoaspartate O-methyltransferase [Novosphingobium capsulatum]WQD93387.1 protein-L-isoaspartate O-methyltransferase [Novosphingobium capsulatum]
MSVAVAEAAETGMVRERKAMIESQLRVSGVNDPAVLAAFAAVAREDFVPADRRALAYMDRAVPLGDGAVLAPALTHGQMLIAAAPVAGERALVVGKPGTYLAALLRELGLVVTLASPADDLAALGQFALVLVDGAIEVVTPALEAAVADDGRLVTGLIERRVARLALGRKAAGQVALGALGEADFAVLPEFAAPKGWSF